MSYLGKVRPTVALTSSDIEDNAVTTSKLIDDAVTTAKIDDGTIATADIADDAVTADKLANAINTSIAANTSKVTNATHTGDVTGATALTIAVDAVDIAMLSATGTASASTFLRGDNAWTAAGGNNSPSFEAYQSTTMASVGHGVTTKVDIDTVIFETTGGDFDTTNNKWTVPSGEGGKYLIFCQVIPDGGASTNLNYVSVWIYLNGAAYMKTYDGWQNTYTRLHTLGITTVMELSAADYLEVFVNLNTVNGSAGKIVISDPKMGHFGGFKLL